MPRGAPKPSSMLRAARHTPRERQSGDAEISAGNTGARDEPYGLGPGRQGEARREPAHARLNAHAIDQEVEVAQSPAPRAASRVFFARMASCVRTASMSAPLPWNGRQKSAWVATGASGRCVEIDHAALGEEAAVAHLDIAFQRTCSRPG